MSAKNNSHQISNYTMLECVLVWRNGKPIQISDGYLKKIIKSFNNINKSDPFCCSFDGTQINF